ncbi:FtsW/RodA/SpoVE family cell cycle protein [uncultured Clostridium sp.]|uniref:FtsW/RodA/SpoVE family cell cycle protein n=1 Tax=uncultured Clostridium sp. TaxID=59620 RepID=UPI002604902C|nr:FtsW/RodA/SpoVE family cell cycle protein [uncultured Clostridium sp.]
MKRSKTAIGILILAYLLCMGMFLNIAILKTPMNMQAIYIGLGICALIGVAYFIVRKACPNGDKFIFLFACIECIIGMGMLYRLHPKDGIKQLAWFVVGLVVFLVVIKFLPDFRQFTKYKKIYLIAVLAFMPMALVFGRDVMGARNWVFIGGFSFQPSEFGKIALVLYLASALRGFKNSTAKENIKQILVPGIVVMYSLGCMVLQNDLGSALIFFGISVTMLFIATAKKKYIALCLGLAAIGSYGAYKVIPHVTLRVEIWLHPWQYAQGKSYQLVQGFYAIASGGALGSGLGQGYPGFVPVNTTDFIFAVICEELGIVFGIGMIIIFFLLFYRSIRTAFVTDNDFLQLAAVGFSAMFACQVLVIIGGIFAVIPLTGIALPFVGYGGTSMITSMFALGILQKISEEG